VPGDSWTVTVPAPAFDITINNETTEILIPPYYQVGSNVVGLNQIGAINGLERTHSESGYWNGDYTKSCTPNHYFQFFGDTQNCRYTLVAMGVNPGATYRLTTGNSGLGSFFNCVNVGNGWKATTDHHLMIIDRNTNEVASWTLTGATFVRTTSLSTTALASTVFPSWVKTSASSTYANSWNAPTIAADPVNGCLNVSWVHPAAGSETFWLVDRVESVEEYH
jgi:hypothetical protein